MTPATVDVDAHSGHRQLVNEYKVFWNKPQGRRILLLQFPGKPHDKPYNDTRRSKPLEIRVKPQSGLVEVDVPIYLDSRYDHDKGFRFNQALRQSKTLQTGGEYGLPGGFGINAQVRHGRPANPSRRDEKDGIYEGTMTRLTMGGRLRFFGSDDPTYAIGIFKDNELHLSKVDGICSLQPQFHHLDAIADNDRIASRIPGVDHPVVESEARAVNMSVKSTDSEQFEVGEIDRSLRQMQEETWQRLDWIDEADARAYTTVENNLFLSDIEGSASLVSAMSERQYLDAISAPRIDPFRQGKRVIINRPWTDDKGEGILEEGESGTADGSTHRMTVESSKSGPVKLKVETD